MDRKTKLKLTALAALVLLMTDPAMAVEAGTGCESLGSTPRGDAYLCW